MVKTVTSFTQSGLKDWLIQRVSAVFIFLYAALVGGFMATHWPLSYAAWHAFNSHIVIQVIGFIALLSILAHAWVGLWTVTTDYIKPAFLRLVIQVLIIALLLAFMVWGVAIFWIF